MIHNPHTLTMMSAVAMWIPNRISPISKTIEIAEIIIGSMHSHSQGVVISRMFLMTPDKAMMAARVLPI